MNLNLEKKLQKLIRNDKLEDAIQIVENELNKYSTTDFPKMIGKDLLHQREELSKYLEAFISQLEKKFSKGCLWRNEWIFNKL